MGGSQIPNETYTSPFTVIQPKKASPPTKMQVPHQFFSAVNADHIYDHCKSQKGLCWVPHWLITCVTNYQLKNQISALLQAEFFPNLHFFLICIFKKYNSLLGAAKTLFFLNTATNFKPISQTTIKELTAADTKRSGSFCAWESTLNFKFSQSLFSCFQETCPILSSSDSSPDVSDLQHLNWLHPWNTLWLGKTTVHGWESKARRLTRKNRQKLHILQSLFLLEMWNWATAGLGWHGDVEAMLSVMGCSWLHVCPVFLNSKCSCSNSKALTMLYNREVCVFPLSTCFLF